MKTLLHLTLGLIAPCTVFFRHRRHGAGVVCLLLQLTIVLWPFALIWALIADGAGASIRAAAADNRRMTDATHTRLSQATRNMAALPLVERIGHLVMLALFVFVSMLIILTAIPWVTHHASLSMVATVTRAGIIALGVSLLFLVLSVNA
ncbi:MAG: hypothetical protein AABY83_15310 [Pseudomonadota bacterium]